MSGQGIFWMDSNMTLVTVLDRGMDYAWNQELKYRMQNQQQDCNCNLAALRYINILVS